MRIAIAFFQPGRRVIVADLINGAIPPAPITLSRADAAELRERVLKFISETLALVKDSPSEELFCLCLDWFRV